MVLVELGDEAVLAEDLQVVGFGDPYKVVEFGLDLGVPVLVIVQKLRIQVVAEQGAAGGEDIAGLTDLNGEDVTGLFVTVQGFHLTFSQILFFVQPPLPKKAITAIKTRFVK